MRLHTQDRETTRRVSELRDQARREHGARGEKLVLRVDQFANQEHAVTLTQFLSEYSPGEQIELQAADSTPLYCFVNGSIWTSG